MSKGLECDYPSIYEIIDTFISETPKGDDYYVCWADIDWRNVNVIASKIVTKSFYNKATKHLEKSYREYDKWENKWGKGRQIELDKLRNH